MENPKCIDVKPEILSSTKTQRRPSCVVSIKDLKKSISDFDMSIIQRDDFACQRCGKTVIDGSAMIAHLKRPSLDELNPDNYICLCKDCEDYERKNIPKSINGFVSALLDAGLLSDEIYNLTYKLCNELYIDLNSLEGEMK